ncbi:fibronectin type III domain-containing protein [Psychroserpens sp. MEBiC05023]
MLKKTGLLACLACLIFACNNDDDLVAACDAVLNVSANTISNNTATISWDDPNTVGSYILEYGVSGFALGSGTTISVTNTFTELTGLNANTSYDIYVQTICSESNVSMNTSVYSFTTLAPPVVPEFRTMLSELNLFVGDLENLTVSPYAFEYDLNTPLFSDYAHKQRFIVLPEGEKMTYDGDGLPLYPDNTLIAKTFYYNLDERDESLGQHIIETRILIKINGVWETGDYKWNDDQTDAILDLNGSFVPVTWIDANGETNSINYSIPSDLQCFTCHRTGEVKKPIGPRLRSLNFNINGVNQLQQLIDSELLEGISDASTVSVLPNWEDAINYTLEERARAYLDMNCAHCHTEGGICESPSSLRLDYETSLNDSDLVNRKNSIINRLTSDFQPGFTMPWIGTTIHHDEGIELVLEYLDTFE